VAAVFFAGNVGDGERGAAATVRNFSSGGSELILRTSRKKNGCTFGGEKMSDRAANAAA
jgi:hypothetical protein